MSKPKYTIKFVVTRSDKPGFRVKAALRDIPLEKAHHPKYGLARLIDVFRHYIDGEEDGANQTK